ncbi:FixH family protein [Novosphingobium sp. B 225]|uniref:FixH family protein n=1 Tax=Novosphingobium sp. B 225 TaxID=1961849 RepID=UPI000B4ACAF4|nr:FixH family protein [Novosphingobium sp. B 225]
MKAFTTGPFTGKHMTAIMVAFFAVVIGVNLIMARYASSTFGGVVVENSYVASQKYNQWLQEAAQEKALGWSATASRLSSGQVAVRLSGAPAGASLTGYVWHPLGRQPDRPLAFAAQPDGSFVSSQEIPAGRWRLRLEVQAQGKKWRTESEIS